MFALAQRFMFDLKVQRTQGTTLFEDATGYHRKLSPSKAAINVLYPTLRFVLVGAEFVRMPNSFKLSSGELKNAALSIPR